MALHPDFPRDPYAVIDPEHRWFPADESLRKEGYDKLLAPFVVKVRQAVRVWRNHNYEGASATSKALLRWWFRESHYMPQADGSTQRFRYYFGQREAIETVIYLIEIAKVKDNLDLMRFDSSGAVKTGDLSESWRRFVLKMATGSGKTKVLSMAIVWSYFHKLYEPDSTLARNFLLIAPNIIVLDRLRADFDGLQIFFQDPLLPTNGFEGQDWQNDFQLHLHIQDDVRITQATGNLFLTNIHRVFLGNAAPPSINDDDLSEYFLGREPVTRTNESQADLGEIIRQVDELMVLNDEAHHIHDKDLAWAKSIQDIHNRLVQKGSSLSLQVDVTATPKHNNGGIFVHTVSDYPLVEAIAQNIVKHPVVPDEASRAKLQEKQSTKFSERYQDYLHLGYLEWKKAFDEHQKVGKKAVLFVMTDDTTNCNLVAEWLQERYSDLNGAVLTIHTNRSGEISESLSGKNKDLLNDLRRAANEIDSISSPYKAIVSVLMLKEGWDVKNVVTIVGLRTYSAQSKILPEQTLGRGLRRMYRGQDFDETVSVLGTNDFMEFVESIKEEGVELKRTGMGQGTQPKAPTVVELDSSKDLEKLDISLPSLSSRYKKEFKNLDRLDPSKFGNAKIKLVQFTVEEQRQIIFRDIASDEVSHVTDLDLAINTDYQLVLAFFARNILKSVRLISGHDVLYVKLKEFVELHLFEVPVSINDLNTLRNLSEPAVTKVINDEFKKAINSLTVELTGDAKVIKAAIKVGNIKPYISKKGITYKPLKSPLTVIVCDSPLEASFAEFLDLCPDVVSFIKNDFSFGFKMDYLNAEGEIHEYFPDFIVKKSNDEIVLVETKGLEDIDVPMKMDRLKIWCEEAESRTGDFFRFVFVDEEDFYRYKFKTFSDLQIAFKKYQ